MALVRLGDARVSRRDLVNERVRGGLEGVDALGTIGAPHRVIHGAGSIQHQHDVQRLGRSLTQVGRRGDSTEGRKEVRVLIFGDDLIATRAREHDVFRRDGLVRPDAADVLGAVLKAPVAPR